MDLSTFSRSINDTLRTMDAECMLAKKSLGIRPNLQEARLHAQNMNIALHQAADLVLRGQAYFGIQQPPDVIDRINAYQSALMAMSNEIFAYDHVVAQRAAAIAVSKKPLN
jgi:hypothetical protein